MSFRIEIDGQYFECPDGETVLLAMNRKSKNYLPVGCCSGGCGVCKVKVLRGDYETKVMSRAKVSIEEETQSYALACRILPRSDLLIEQFKSLKT